VGLPDDGKKMYMAPRENVTGNKAFISPGSYIHRMELVSL
jgi:hypothetical protein